jgi:GH35 family endo-1,4-beta-xylanase
VTESGSLQIPWPVQGFGTPMLRTATLAQRATPYWLPLELARGKLDQVRNQLANWQSIGLKVEAALHEELGEAHRRFYRAATSSREDQGNARAQEALAAALRVGENLVGHYGRQVLALRHQQYARLVTLWGCQLGDVGPDATWSKTIPAAFNSVRVPMNWRHIEPEEGQYQWDVYDRQVKWCRQHRLVMRGGPLVLLGSEGLPDWLWLWEQDAANLLSCMSDFVETAVSRYQSRIRIWEVTARTNTSDSLSLSEEQRLRLTVQMLEVARQVDPEARFLIRLDQPWGEYVATGEHDLSPLHFADTLLRAGLGLTAVDLEINFGYASPGSWPRDLLEFSRLLDQWSYLGIPLYVTLAVPSGEGPDPRATGSTIALRDAWSRPWDEAAQNEWIERYLPLILAKPAVQAVTWCHFSDADPHELPHAGLVRADGTAKPALHTLAKFRKEHLQ